MAAKWALIGKDGDPYTEKAAEMLGLRSPYEIRRRGGFLYFRTPYEDRLHSKPIRVSEPITQDNFKNDSLYELLNDQYGNYSQIGDLSSDKLLEILSKYQDFRRFEKMTKTVFYASRGELVEVFTETLAPYFFGLYPNGSIYISCVDISLHTKLAALRVLGSLDRIADRDVEKIQGFTNFLTLSGAQPSSIVSPSKYLTIPLALSLPRPIGFAAPRIVDCALFFFDTQLGDVRNPFPASANDFYRSKSSQLFSDEKDDALDEKGRLDPEAIDTFALITREFSQYEWWDFVRQYLASLNRLISYLTDPANFVDQDGKWVNITHYLIWLSFERLCDEIILLLTEQNHYLRKMAAFRVLDQLASLMYDEPRNQAELFKEFIIPGLEEDVIGQGLGSYSGEIAKCLFESLSSIRVELSSTVLESIQFGEKVDESEDNVVLHNGEEVNANEYVRRVVRQLRNTAHGYSSINSYLLTNKGNIPDDFPLLSVLAFFAFIAKPSSFLRSTWN